MAEAKPAAGASAGWRSPGAVPIVMLFVLGLSFGIIFSLNRWATTNGVPFVPFVFWQALGGAVILLVLSALLRKLPRLGWPHIRVYMATGALNLAIPYAIFAFVAPKVPAGILSIGLSLVPVFIYALALGVRLDRFRITRFGGIVLGLIGVLLVLVPQASLPSPDMVPWVALGLAAPLCYAVNAIVVALMRPPETSSVPLACGLMAAASLFVLIAMAATSDWWAFDAPWGDGHWATIGAMANNAVAFYLIFELIRRAGPVFFSTVNYVATLAGMGFGIWFFGDAHSWWIWLAVALMFAGLFFVNFTGRSRPANE